MSENRLSQLTNAETYESFQHPICDATNTIAHHRSYLTSHFCVFLMIAALLRSLMMLFASAEISATESPRT